MRPVARLGAMLSAAIVAAACGGGAERGAADTAASATATGASGAAVATPAPADTCPKYGLWQRCSVEDRLERAGFVLDTAPEPARRAWFATPGVTYRFPNGELEVYIYPTVAARRVASAALDSARAAPRGENAGYRWPPTLILSGNLLAVLSTPNARLAERVQLALTAGLPENAP